MPQGFRVSLVTGCLIACVLGCATSPADDVPPARQVVAKATRVADWNQLAKSLTGLASVCGAVGKSKEGQEATGIAVPAGCLFSDGDAKLTETAKPAVVTIARELNRVTEREFWINARAANGDASAGRLNSARAQALVGALVAAGVSASRLAAVVGINDADPTTYGSLSGAALVEIIVAPNADEDVAPRRYPGR